MHERIFKIYAFTSILKDFELTIVNSYYSVIILNLILTFCRTQTTICRTQTNV